jgi:glycosyltransferase involved in cell wall biosynthesis
MKKVEESILSQSVVEGRVIPTGIDLTVFHRGDKSSARAVLNLPQDARILLFTANGIRRNMWKDYKTLKSAVEYVGQRLRQMKILCVALGEDSPPEHLGGAEVRFVPFQNNAATVAQYYQAADLYVHAARADTFPRAVLEAISCGTPVVATAVGGIAEQIKGLRDDRSPGVLLNPYGEEKATGVLVACGDIKATALAIERILTNDRLRCLMSENACRDAEERFNLQDQTDRYLEWYRELLDKKSKVKDTFCFAE